VYIYKIFGDFRMLVEYAMKLSRTCFNNDKCTVVLARLQILHGSKLKYFNTVVNIEYINIFIILSNQFKAKALTPAIVATRGHLAKMLMRCCSQGERLTNWS
jgi:hypothetical protein